MSLLKVTCPKCRSEADTGLHADEQTLKDLGPKLQVLVLCEECHEYQKMLVGEMYLDTDPAESAASAALQNYGSPVLRRLL